MRRFRANIVIPGRCFLTGKKTKGRGQANTVVNKIYEIVAAATAAPRQVGSGQRAGGGGEEKRTEEGLKPR